MIRLSPLSESGLRLCLKRFVSFGDLGVDSKIVKGLRKLNILNATDIQVKSIPLGLRNCSPIAISSETGSGKTLAYLVPFLNHLITDPHLRMLVLLPRKELAFQVEQVVHQLAPNAATAVAVGKWKGMEEGVFPSIVLGTPKPVYEYLRRAFGKKSLEMLQQYRRTFSTLVLDEADVVLNDPFYRYTLDSLHLLERANADLQVVAAGATLPRNGKMTAGGILSHEFPQIYWCETSGRSSVPENIRVRFIEQVEEEQKMNELKKLAGKLRGGNSILFVRNASRAEQVAESLAGMNIKVQVLSQDLDDVQRDQAVRRVLEGSAMCTVCTDLVSRGLDTRNVNLVVQYDFATDVSAFLHRCGRTGRNGAQGEVICFVSPENELLASRIQKCGVHNDLSSLFSRKRLLRKKAKKEGCCV
ncbi:uncharacterized protein [Blastocystis hominis]|uniref:ATP-dependent RNA helicase n=1 Tax=Blastocystis hominis TaxID=12968 RepID=D8LZJ7_BLAHO|nr:uncharacterized protein [Blastocystis hominis]CBK21236.2 unnamed protein product [Blastocystis hominis]|eukprot:XP_012895284.1 uncharacterized protein [Blastocystis hominis]